MNLRHSLAFACLIVPAAAFAQSATAPTAPTCSALSYRGLDFLVGDWRIVETANGKLFATNKVRRENDGCAIREDLAMVGGARGLSLNFYLPSDGIWHTIYHDSGGHFAHLTGALANGRHQVGGQVRLPHDPARLRNVRQVTDRNSAGLPHQVGYLEDEKGSWSVLYDVTFCPAAPAAPASSHGRPCG